MRKIVITLVLLLSVFGARTASSQTQQCDGPAELCAQVTELRQKLQDARADDKVVSDSDTSDKAVKAMSVAAGVAVALKILISMLKNYGSIFTTDRGKALMRVTTVGVGLVAFILTNVGFGMNWWQAMIVAGGGPGSIALHEIMKLIPVILGKTKLPNDPPVEDPGMPQA